MELPMQDGVRLTGLDLPSEADDKLRIFVAVQVVDGERAPTHVALIVRKTCGSETKVAKAIKILATSEVAIGIELAMEQEGTQTIQATVFAADENGETTPLFVFEPRDCLVRFSQPQEPEIQEKTECVSSIAGLPRLMQKDSLVLCGVDIPEQTEGKLRVMVALKRVWNDAPREVALIVRNLLPNGERRAAVVHKVLGDDAEAFGLEVPVLEAGAHTITLQIAKKDVDGELVEVFRIEGKTVNVSNPPPVILAECNNVQLVGVDVPSHVEGTMNAIVAVRRTSHAAATNLVLIIRNTLPNGTSRAALVRKTVTDLNLAAIGGALPLGEAGEHHVELSIAAENDDGSLEVLLRIPTFAVQVTNPPAPKIMEDVRRALVLCGVDINGARFPDFRANEVVDADVKVQVTLARTWEDAPTHFAVLVHNVLPSGERRSVVVRKTILDLEPTNMGLQAPVKEPGDHMLEVSVVEVDAASGQLGDVVFVLPPVKVHSPVPPPDAFELASAASEEIITTNVSFKATLDDANSSKIIRRVSVPLRLAANGLVAEGFADFNSALHTAFRNELMGRQARFSYEDSDGDQVAVSSDVELGDAIMQQKNAAGVVRILLTPK